MATLGIKAERNRGKIVTYSWRDLLIGESDTILPNFVFSKWNDKIRSSKLRMISKSLIYMIS
jgi:hypothetical protein